MQTGVDAGLELAKMVPHLTYLCSWLAALTLQHSSGPSLTVVWSWGVLDLTVVLLSNLALHVLKSDG